MSPSIMAVVLGHIETSTLYKNTGHKQKRSRRRNIRRRRNQKMGWKSFAWTSSTKPMWIMHLTFHVFHSHVYTVVLYSVCVRCRCHRHRHPKIIITACECTTEYVRQKARNASYTALIGFTVRQNDRFIRSPLQFGRDYAECIHNTCRYGMYLQSVHGHFGICSKWMNNIICNKNSWSSALSLSLPHPLDLSLFQSRHLHQNIWDSFFFVFCSLNVCVVSHLFQTKFKSTHDSGRANVISVKNFRWSGWNHLNSDTWSYVYAICIQPHHAYLLHENRKLRAIQY